jgi:RimJ/RimL family protein N-acetyltransferase
VLKGQRVVLRAFTREDMTRQWESENDAELSFLDGGRPRAVSMEKMMAYFDGYVAKDDPNHVSWAIETDAKYIGHCALHSVDAAARTCELGIEIGDRAYWGRGYGREVIGLMLNYAFQHMNLHRVWLTTHSENERAMRCYKACGFVEEARLRQHVWIDGRYVDRVMMGVLRREFGG